MATHSPPGSPTELDALRLAADAAKQGIDTGVYLQVCVAGDSGSQLCGARGQGVCKRTPPLTHPSLSSVASQTQVTERIAGRLGAAYATDGDWVDETNRKAAQARAGLVWVLLTLSCRPVHSRAQPDATLARRPWSAWTRSSSETRGPSPRCARVVLTPLLAQGNS